MTILIQAVVVRGRIGLNLRHNGDMHLPRYNASGFQSLPLFQYTSMQIREIGEAVMIQDARMLALHAHLGLRTLVVPGACMNKRE
jgi:hypothetical protein